MNRRAVLPQQKRAPSSTPTPKPPESAQAERVKYPTVARIVVLTAALIATIGLAHGQPAPRKQQVGVLFVAVSPSIVGGPAHSWARVFRQSLAERGWTDGGNVEIIWRSADYRPEAIPTILEELVRRPVDLIVVSSTTTALEAIKKTRRIPIVVANSYYPVESGLATSLSRPGGNVTGRANNAGGIEINGKQLALLKEAAPHVSRVAYLTSPLTVNEDRFAAGGVDGAGIPNRTVAAGRALGVTLVRVEVGPETRLEEAVAEAVRLGANGLMVDIEREQPLMVDLAERHKLPAVYLFESGVEAGGLMHYGPTAAETGRQVASFVDRILRGARAADLAFEAPTKLRLTINLKAAKAIGLTVQPSVLVRADRVIE